MNPLRVRAVTLDATGTLFHSPRLGQVYAEVLTRHGYAVDALAARELILEVWQEFDCANDTGSDRFGTHPEGAAGWWRRFLERFCEHLDAPPPTRFAAAELYDRFGRAEAWSLYPEVESTLAALRRAGLRVAVIANWDERLPRLLARLGIGEAFESIVTSQGAGVEKPHPLIFQTALSLLELPAEQVLHLGDRELEDVEGPKALGMHARRVDRSIGADLRTLTRELTVVAESSVRFVT